MLEIKNQIIEPIINNPKVQMAVGTGLMALPVDVNLVKALNVYVTFFGGIVGLLIGLTVLYKNIKQIRSEK